ncbi:uncharacterized protein PV07_01238 [Cladophialophora immunda]|uniref:Uncharacterized protein n=1 Tax=Cladophialophora immunda TaxID=569365 RepID=A0A0D2CX88_9EURO|nr:uncharacterized protein PV07_01238 [Cladophialophora immunda]KIW34460.1 hypothetical protein PV07_01238 [Cladophialophora immunda]OQV09314.1 hypothetical protein CLAIMM_13448 [Cladophialophora immunda]
MRSSILIAALSTLATRTIAANIVLGHAPSSIDHFTPFQVAWISGEDPCSEAVHIAPNDDNPCGIRFSLHQFHDLHFEGCGGPLEIWQSDTLIGGCIDAPKEIGCGIFTNSKYLGEFLCAFK